jgi:hypothetical protein
MLNFQGRLRDGDARSSQANSVYYHNCSVFVRAFFEAVSDMLQDYAIPTPELTQDISGILPLPVKMIPEKS